MKSAKSLLLLLILLVVPSKMWAQFEVSTTGGGVVNETGSFDYTLGQVSSAYDVGYQVGVHQPYAHPSFDTLRGVVCQGNDFVGFGYTIPADSSPRQAFMHFYGDMKMQEDLTASSR